MTESTQPPSGDTPPTDGTTGSSPHQFATVEEADAYWRTRQSGIQRAHNAEVESLQRQMDALRKIGSTQEPPVSEHPDTVRARELEQQLQSERTANTLRSKYPDAATLLGDEITKVAEEKIAAVNAVFQQQAAAPQNGGPPIIDPNLPPRSPSGGNPPIKRNEDMDEDQLKDQLRALEPAYREMISNR